MQVSQYLFQSPSPQQVQIGKPDPNVKQESTSTQSDSLPNETLSKAQSFAVTQISEVTPTVGDSDSAPLLDVYA